MCYKSPIEVITTKMRVEYEDNIMKAIGAYDIHVDKEELVKALKYDREQYEAGYKARDEEIIRCKDCKYWEYNIIYDEVIAKTLPAGFPVVHNSMCRRNYGMWLADDFCKYAERKEQKWDSQKF